ncbi:MAG: hypothetical protein CL441_06960, partial [Acidimicrobiaceae bacterium]|nr:hypothetical protein [Acidimicrobiaceae bacterium]
ETHADYRTFDPAADSSCNRNRFAAKTPTDLRSVVLWDIANLLALNDDHDRIRVVLIVWLRDKTGDYRTLAIMTAL